ncbi:MAG: nucleotide pyrophosphohydrolase [Planctomycetes bacterium]|nr:nucleotide pyrophosphohydrolase [Planctomycetota bacterium]
MQLGEFQKLIEDIYYERDHGRGLGGTFLWFIEEVGELATALREGDEASKREEFADCLAWLTTLASLSGIRMEDAVQKYAGGCPRCGGTPCDCPTKP